MVSLNIQYTVLTRLYLVTFVVKVGNYVTRNSDQSFHGGNSVQMIFVLMANDTGLQLMQMSCQYRWGW